MSDETPERSEMMRSTIITVLLTVVFFVIGLAFWAWSSPEVIDTSPVGAINEMNPALTVLIEVLVMVMAFIFLSVTAINLKLMLTNIRAGWTEVIVILIVMAIMSSAMFGLFVGAATVVLSLGFVVYLYLLQD
ncbi:MAG: hypothetical protein ThorAB25_10630 [Candidatus Thorarchaeota archaeon AB_25]|nr:MAG: hypothetical protein ThorAB25_10630 [Candidatus Thorarchaeota archaeon AB_25]